MIHAAFQAAIQITRCTVQEHRNSPPNKDPLSDAEGLGSVSWSLDVMTDGPLQFQDRAAIQQSRAV
jgi:hypothetical protein